MLGSKLAMAEIAVEEGAPTLGHYGSFWPGTMFRIAVAALLDSTPAVFCCSCEVAADVG